ncbi:3'-5' exoribonuclease YhaM family protein [Desulfolucanica intricata]|uniref:3'-5' exoribonuclease YhaM family protein n=1 Tax=Desulfolucanica intricata TaxID=1285191 RepID=UPI00083373A6|nr:HD domain-containing protein [Desulfolucanica intricata]
MGRVCVTELKVGQKIESVFIIKNKRLVNYRERTGQFLTLVLGDCTGKVDAVLWQDAEDVYHSLPRGELVTVTGVVKEYSGSPQLNIFTISAYKGKEYNPADFLPVSPRSREEMLNNLMTLLASVKNTHLQSLLKLFFSDTNWLEAFTSAPAAKKNHHAYLGGLLEHSLNVATAAERIAGVYPKVDRDLLITGAVLHDIGKIKEYSYRLDIDFTDQGRLLGHIILGVQMVEEQINKIAAFPKALRLKLLHIIASHHGQYEWQSPKRPKFTEAAIIHQLDQLDAIVDMFSSVSEQNDGNNSCWGGWVKGLERYVYIG